jgi:hypothetical protein
VRIAYFTAGSHGAGHLVRGVALERALQRRAAAFEYRLFSPPSAFARVAQGFHQPISVDAAELREPARARTSALARALAAFEPDLLIVDLFWVPLAFVPVRCPTWLLLRSVPPWWLVGPKESRFDTARYERIFAIEPAPGLSAFEALPPVVVANPDEARSRDELCARLDADPSRPLHVTMRAGLSADAGPLAAVRAHPEAQVRELDLALPDAPFPMAPWLTGLAPRARLVAAPGYNTFWEAQWLGFAQRVTWVPIARTLDDAAWRAHASPPPDWRENGADLLAARALARG